VGIARGAGCAACARASVPARAGGPAVGRTRRACARLEPTGSGGRAGSGSAIPDRAVLEPARDRGSLGRPAPCGPSTDCSGCRLGRAGGVRPGTAADRRPVLGCACRPLVVARSWMGRALGRAGVGHPKDRGAGGAACTVMDGAGCSRTPQPPSACGLERAAGTGMVGARGIRPGPPDRRRPRRWSDGGAAVARSVWR
jgi:hypothetical protein